jgi:phospholipid/cholesterol/gamma-HCH transport system permease protein
LWFVASESLTLSRAHRNDREERRAFTLEGDGATVRLGGELRMEEAGLLWEELGRAVDERTRTIDLAAVHGADGSALALVAARAAAGGENSIRIEGANDDVARLLELYAPRASDGPPPKRKPESAIAQVGGATLAYAGEVRAVLSFFGEMVLALGSLVRHPRNGHWREVPPLVEKTGADAVPIVVLINFLVGFVMAYQSAKQLKMFGANIYVADLVGLSVTRELAPLMTAIIVCGRSGAAFAAEIATMKVNDEVDALRTIGLRPFAWLVVPRVLALLLVVPLLTLLGDLVGFAGGLFVGVTSLDLTVQGYFIETQKSVELWDVWHGVIKSVAFALAIALISCQQGFAASGGAEGVGRRTTATVVTSLFALVVLDATFTIVFRAFGL